MWYFYTLLLDTRLHIICICQSTKILHMGLTIMTWNMIHIHNSLLSIAGINLGLNKLLVGIVEIYLVYFQKIIIKLAIQKESSGNWTVRPSGWLGATTILDVTSMLRIITWSSAHRSSDLSSIWYNTFSNFKESRMYNRD